VALELGVTPSVAFTRVEYDVATAAAAIRATALPQEFAMAIEP
jgi:hypothetical protein